MKQKHWARIGDLLSDANGLPWKKKLERYELWPRWAQIVGPTIALHAWPVSWRAQTLVVHASNHVWIQELQFMRSDLLAKIKAACPALAIDGIRFEAGGGTDQPVTAETTRDTPIELPPLSQDERSFAREAVRPIADDKTRASVRRLIEKDLSLKKTRKRT